MMFTPKGQKKEELEPKPLPEDEMEFKNIRFEP